MVPCFLCLAAHLLVRASVGCCTTACLPLAQDALNAIMCMECAVDEQTTNHATCFHTPHHQPTHAQTTSQSGNQGERGSKPVDGAGLVDRISLPESLVLAALVDKLLEEEAGVLGTARRLGVKLREGDETRSDITQGLLGRAQHAPRRTIECEIRRISRTTTARRGRERATELVRYRMRNVGDDDHHHGDDSCFQNVTCTEK